MKDIEDTEFVASEHDYLVRAVSKLDKTQHISAPTRNEPTNLNSEFNLLKRSNKLDLRKVVHVLKDTAHHTKISKKLKKTQDASTVLPKPLEKPQAERIKRATGYEETKKKIGRWDPVVAQSRTVDYVTFPLRSESNNLQPTDEFISKFKLKSPLEKELEQIDPPVGEAEEVEEEEKIYPMSYLEMVEHRQHLAKLRAQQSYKAAKAKRQSKIKSKKYHRILKKEKLKKQLEEFEDLQKDNPEEALKRLETLEKARALERHTLRHKNTGKWAKNQMIRAKYDKEVRQQLAEQLAVSRSLTKKVQDTESTDDEAEDNEAIPDKTILQDPMNPWMLKRSDKSNVDAEFDFGYKKYVQIKMNKQKSNGDTNSEDESDLEITDKFKMIKESIEKLSGRKSLNNDYSSNIESVGFKSIQKAVKKNRCNNQKCAATATSKWLVEPIDVADGKKENITEEISSAFDSLENEATDAVEKKLNMIRKTIQTLEKNRKVRKDLTLKKGEETDNLEALKFKNHKKRVIIDEELIEIDTKNTSEENKTKEDSPLKILACPEVTSQENSNSNIDPSSFMNIKPKYLNTVLPSGEHELDQLDDDEQIVPKVNIEEVFEEDDVVASFRQEKEDEINKDQPNHIDLSLPGWGSWGGKGVKAPKRKKNRFILKAPPKMPRRDENKGDVIIKEFKNPQLAVHKVTEVPFPFQSVKDYEASIRAPLGNTFIPEKAHKQLIHPSVITKAGTIIEPMDEEELLSKKNRIFKNINVLNLLAKQ